MIKIALLGYGTIGSGVDEVLRVNRDVIEKRVGDAIEIKYVLDLRDFPGEPIQEKIVHDINVILEDPEIRIVTEAMGGVEPAHTFAVQTLKKGKHFVTSNKALIAEYGAELLELGRENHASVLFEASVGGGIPILRPLNTCLTADIIEEITGILNGTTNYMLTSMTEDGAEFEDVLKEAQAKGYAEADPTADIEGYDACRKIAILTSLVCGRQVDFETIHTEGITEISALDILYASELGKHIKLLATSRRIGEKYCAMVAPLLIDASHPLYSVNDVFNSIFVKGNMVGDTMFYGAGAGSLPTASAVVSDIIEAAQKPGYHIPIAWSAQKEELLDYRTLEWSYFVRSEEEDSEKIEKAFGPVEWIALQDGPEETAFVTQKMDGFAFEKAVSQIDNVLQIIRID